MLQTAMDAMKAVAVRMTAALVFSSTAPIRASPPPLMPISLPLLNSAAAVCYHQTISSSRLLFSSCSHRRFCTTTASSSPMQANDSSSSTCDTKPTTSNPTSTPDSDGGDPIKEAADLLDIRVGRILKAWRHPEADTLYVEEVDVGEPEPRTICSGLVKYIPQEDLKDRSVVVLANLKARNMRGVKSNGMLMAASDALHENVELLLPPEGSIPGERIWFGLEEEKNKQPDAATPNQVLKKKIWESVQPHLKTTDSCVAVLGEHEMRTSAGAVVCTSLKNANIS